MTKNKKWLALLFVGLCLLWTGAWLALTLYPLTSVYSIQSPFLTMSVVIQCLWLLLLLCAAYLLIKRSEISRAWFVLLLLSISVGMLSQMALVIFFFAGMS